MPAIPDYVYCIPFIPPSNNKYMGRENKWEYQADKREWLKYVNFFCNPKPKKPIQRAIVFIEYYFRDKRRRDPDNYSGKMILDGLVRTGILVDDSFNNIRLMLEGYVDAENPRTEIRIADISIPKKEG